jgi:hypothetical protein
LRRRLTGTSFIFSELRVITGAEVRVLPVRMVLLA